MKRCTIVALTNATPGREQEFNDWYDNQHVHDVLKVPGFVSAQRFACEDVPGFPAPKYKYCALFEVEGENPGQSVVELFSRHGTPELPASDAMDPDVYFVLYQPTSPVIRK